jgi:branched-subunit amino acid ABC-type transport system permease component
LAGHAYHAGWIEEQSLLAHVAGKGLVVICGCGHPGIVETATAAVQMTGLPLFAVVGGLHLYLGASNAGPLAGLSSRRLLALPQTERSLSSALQALLALGLREVYLSTHDSSAPTCTFFAEQLGDGFHTLQAGQAITL